MTWEVAKYNFRPNVNKVMQIRTDRQAKYKESPLDALFFNYWDSAEWYLWSTRAWIQHFSGLLMSKIVSMTSLLCTVTLSKAHQIAFLFFKDFENDINFVIKMTIRFRFFQKKVEVQMIRKVAWYHSNSFPPLIFLR